MPKLFIIHGYPGTGKSTIAGKFAKKHHYALLRQDVFLFQMNGVKNPEYGATSEDHQLTIRNMIDCMENFMSVDRNIVIEGALVSISDKDDFDMHDFISLAKQKKYNIVIMRLIADNQTRYRNMEKRGYVVPKKIDETLQAATDNLKVENEKTINMTDKSVDEAVGLLEEFIE